jgi:hypothetical protein
MKTGSFRALIVGFEALIFPVTPISRADDHKVDPRSLYLTSISLSP